jgi:hypothetical protein
MPMQAIAEGDQDPAVVSVTDTDRNSSPTVTDGDAAVSASNLKDIQDAKKDAEIAALRGELFDLSSCVSY